MSGEEQNPGIDMFEDYELEQPEPSDEVLEKHLPLLRPMLEYGLSIDVAVVLLEFAGTKLSLEDRRFLLGPIVQHGSDWRDNTPEWMFAQARLERWEIIVDKTRPGPIGPTELAAVMYGAMLDAPRAETINDLYLWAGVQAAARHYEKAAADYWKSLGIKPIADAEVFGKRGRLHQDFQLLAGAVRRNVIEHQAVREKRYAAQVEGRKRWEQEEAERAARYRASPPPPKDEPEQESML